MEISIPFTNLKFTGKCLWNFPKDDGEKDEISTNNFILVVFAWCLSTLGFFGFIPLFFAQLGILVYAFVASQRKMHQYVYASKSKVYEKLNLIFTMTHVVVVVLIVASIVALPFEGIRGIMHFLQICALGFYVYVYRDVVAKGWAYFKSKPWF
jgi:hypothetical protein